MSSTSQTKILWLFSEVMVMMESLEVQDPGEALDALSIMIDRLLPLSQRLESLYVTGDATSKGTPSI